jgi:RNA polymerase I-specific transcription initiation factor RRN3
LSQFFTGSYATGGALRDTGVDFDDEKWAHLEACFPFDPFQLPIAKRWLDLQNSYVTWQSMAVLDRDDGGLEEGDEDEDESEVDADDSGDDEDDDGDDYGEAAEVSFQEEDTATEDDGLVDYD